MQPGALRKRDIEVRVGRPEVDRHRLQHEAEAPLGVEPVGANRGRLYWRRRPQSPKQTLEQIAEWSQRPGHCGTRDQLASHSLTETGRTQSFPHEAPLAGSRINAGWRGTKPSRSGRPYRP